MAPLMLLLIYLTAAASDLIEVPVDPGDDVILPCQADDSSISAVEWSRPDLDPDIVLLNIDGHLKSTYQNPSFKERVDLVDRDLKDGDVSLTLKNVSSIDNGTYECRVKPDGSRHRKRAIIDSEPIRIIRLQVREPAGQKSAMIDVPEDGNSSPGGRYHGLAAGVPVGLLLVVVAVVCVLMYKRHKDMRPGPPADDADPLHESPPCRGGGACVPESENCIVWSSRVSHDRLVADKGETKSDSLQINF
ncbi:uncharacterized protein LOC114574096 isoform X2 [Perca flavescens]|uniref:uncharacterized protein LOC114574096 isoform X2 n=1 Tax=Perca flavescens TaxID=8167 RepID=UPI00106E8EC3|nr:uncharacterized protein LOC114574096 isoform X2 [Perca flavescens]